MAALLPSFPPPSNPSRSYVRCTFGLPSGLHLTELPSSLNGTPLPVCVLKHDSVLLRPSHRRVKELRSALTPKECSRIVALAESHPSGWQSSRHSHYATTDIPVEDLFPGLAGSNFIEDLVNETVLPEISAFFGLRRDFLHVADLFVVKYQYVEGKQAGLDEHVDGSPWSFVVPLNAPSCYVGGGTRFVNVEDGASPLTCRPALGSALVFSGKNRHSGVAITSGVRYILTGFCDYVPEFEDDGITAHEGFMTHYDARYDGTAARGGIRTGDIVRGVYDDGGQLHMLAGGEEEGLSDDVKLLMARVRGQNIDIEEDTNGEERVAVRPREKKGKVFSLLVERMNDTTNYEEEEEEKEEEEEQDKQFTEDDVVSAAVRVATATIDHDTADDRALLDLIHNVYQFLSVGQYFKWDRE